MHVIVIALQYLTRPVATNHYEVLALAILKPKFDSDMIGHSATNI